MEGNSFIKLRGGTEYIRPLNFDTVALLSLSYNQFTHTHTHTHLHVCIYQEVGEHDLSYFPFVGMNQKLL